LVYIKKINKRHFFVFLFAIIQTFLLLAWILSLFLTTRLKMPGIRIW